MNILHEAGPPVNPRLTKIEPGIHPPPRRVDLRRLVATWPRLSWPQRAAALWRLREEERAR